MLGLLGRTFDDGRREWLARLGAWTGLYALAWIVAVGFSLFGYDAVQWLKATLSAGIPAVLAWAGTTVGGLLAGKSFHDCGSKR